VTTLDARLDLVDRFFTGAGGAAPGARPSGYRTLLTPQRLASLTAALAALPLSLDGSESDPELATLRAALEAVDSATAALLEDLDAAARRLAQEAAPGTDQIPAIVTGGRTLLESCAKGAYVQTLIHLGAFTRPDSLRPRLAELRHLEPKRMLTGAEARAELARLLLDADLAYGSPALSESAAVDLDSEEAAALFEIKPGDSWQRVIGIALSLRQFGRITEAVRAFALYGEMFEAAYPSARAYAKHAQQFTLQHRALGRTGGVYIYELAPGSAAAAAGLAEGDIIVAYGNSATSGMHAFLSARIRIPEGETVRVEVARMNEAGRFAVRRFDVVNGPLGVGLMPI
jgi:hypothetical protein